MPEIAIWLRSYTPSFSDSFGSPDLTNQNLKIDPEHHKKPLERESKPIRFEDGKRHVCSCCPTADKKRTVFAALFVKEQHVMNIELTFV